MGMHSWGVLPNDILGFSHPLTRVGRGVVRVCLHLWGGVWLWPMGQRGSWVMLPGSSLSSQTCSSFLQQSNQDHCPIFIQNSWVSPSFSVVSPCPPCPQMSSVGEGKKHLLLPSFGSVAGALQMSLIRERWTGEKAYKFYLMLIFMWHGGLLRKEVKTLEKQVGLRVHIPFLMKSDKLWRWQDKGEGFKDFWGLQTVEK